MLITSSLFITNPTNIRYLTGFVGVEQRDAYLLILSTKAYLFVSQLYQEETKHISLKNSFLARHFPNIQSLEICILTQNNRITKQLETIAQKESIQALSFESDNLSVFEYTAFKNALQTVPLTPTTGVIETLRIQKFPSEIASITNAAKLTDECFTFIQTKIKKGVTESALAWEIETYFRKAGAQLAFSPIVAFGENTSKPHHQSSGVRLQSSDIILVDVGAKIDGYCADMTRMIFVGKPKDEWLNAYKAVLDAQTAALTSISHNRSGKLADQAARDVLEKTTFPIYPHSLGHGVGLDIHEAPRLTIYQDASLKPHMVVTVEPGTYTAGQFGIRIEDLVLITDSGIEVLSKSTKDVIMLI